MNICKKWAVGIVGAATHIEIIAGVFVTLITYI